MNHNFLLISQILNEMYIEDNVKKTIIKYVMIGGIAVPATAAGITTASALLKSKKINQKQKNVNKKNN